MTGYLIAAVFYLTCLAVFVVYWVRRLDRSHRERLAWIEASEAADRARFEARERAWAEETAKARAESEARLVKIREQTRELEDLDAEYSRVDEVSSEEEDPNRPLVPTEEELLRVPRWALVAFAARCARRMVPVYRYLSSLEETVWTMARAVELAERTAEYGRFEHRDRAFEYSRQLSEAAEFTSLPGASNAAMAVACAVVTAERYQHLATALETWRYAIGALSGVATFGTVSIITIPARDFDRLRRLAEQEHWTDDTPVPQSVFGPMWEGEPPPWWTDDVLAGLPPETKPTNENETKAKVEEKEEETAGG